MGIGGDKIFIFLFSFLGIIWDFYNEFFFLLFIRKIKFGNLIMVVLADYGRFMDLKFRSVNKISGEDILDG